MCQTMYWIYPQPVNNPTLIGTSGILKVPRVVDPVDPNYDTVDGSEIRRLPPGVYETL